MSFLVDLECRMCGKNQSAERLQNLCPSCGKPLLARYDLAAVRKVMTPKAMASRASTLWR